MTDYKDSLKPASDGIGYEYDSQSTKFGLWMAGIHTRLNLLLHGKFEILRILHIGAQFGSGKITREQAQDKVEHL